MKKYICTLIIMICSLAFCCPAAFAGKRDLIDSAGEREEIGEAAEDIIFAVNYGGARGDIPRKITEADIDFEKAYRIYSCSDLFKKKTDKNSDIIEMLNESYCTWQIPLFIEGNTVLFNLSKVTHIDEDIPEDAKESLKEKLGVWSPAGSITYKNQIVDLNANVDNSLKNAGLPPENYTYEFVSGIPGIRYPVAIVFDEEKALYVIPAEDASARTFNGDWETVSAENEVPGEISGEESIPAGDVFPVYHFDDVSAASRHLPLFTTLGIEPYKPGPFPFLAGSAVLALLLCAVRTIRRRRIS